MLRNSSRCVRALSLLVSVGGAFVGACVVGPSDSDSDVDERFAQIDAFDAGVGGDSGDSGGSGDWPDVGGGSSTFLEDLELELSAREATTRQAYADCVGVEPSQGELDGWLGAGLDGDALYAALCGMPSEPASELERVAWIDDAHTDCLGRPASEEEVEYWLGENLDLAATFAGICESEESLRRVIDGAYLHYAERPVTAAELDGWLDTGLLRVALVRQIAAAPDAARVRVVRDAYLTCLGRAASADEVRGWVDQALTEDQLRAGICGSQEARRLIVVTAYRECLNRVPSEGEITGWVDGATALEDLRAGICESTEAQLRRSIAGSYRTCLGREASPAEIDAWVATGGNAGDIGNSICSSAEARRHAVATAYTGCLGRAASPAEIQLWADLEASIADIRSGICHSSEARRHAIRLAYRQCLRRQPSVGEIDSWDGTQLSGWEIRWAICHSAEAATNPVQVISHLQPKPPGWFYDIFRNNCHTAANLGVRNSPGDTGIVACRPNQTGLGPRGNGVGGHTFNYVVGGGNTSYYNWGPPPCVCPGTPPASYATAGCHRTCVDRMCLGQFDSTTRALPIGQTVEVPGPSICAAQTFGTGSLGDCNTCCDTRADTRWSGPPDDPTNALRETYRYECKQSCTNVFK
jgi:hypothetical protein